MGYVIAAFLLLGAFVYLGITIGYSLFAGVMTVVNPVVETTSGRPAAHLHADMMMEVRANTSVNYEVVQLRSRGGAYAENYRDYQIEYTISNRSRFKIVSVQPVCTISYADGTSTQLQVIKDAVRTTLDGPTTVESGALAGETVRRVLATQQVKNRLPSPVTRADCTFNYTINWWVWSADAAKQGSGS